MSNFNGRVFWNEINVNKEKLFYEDNNNESFDKVAVSAIYEPNKVQSFFFSNYNIEKLQKLIRYNVYIQSKKKHIIGKQDTTSLKIIMKSIYLQYGKNLNQDINNQINELNTLVLDYSIPNILSNIEMYLTYKKDVSKLPEPIERPTYISIAGTRTNNNLIN